MRYTLKGVKVKETFGGKNARDEAITRGAQLSAEGVWDNEITSDDHEDQFIGSEIDKRVRGTGV